MKIELWSDNLDVDRVFVLNRDTGKVFSIALMSSLRLACRKLERGKGIDSGYYSRSLGSHTLPGEFLFGKKGYYDDESR